MLVVKMRLIPDVDLIVILLSYAYSKSGLSVLTDLSGVQIDDITVRILQKCEEATHFSISDRADRASPAKKIKNTPDNSSNWALWFF